MATYLQALDQKLADLLAQWNIYTVLLVAAVVGLGALTLLTATVPDVHPILLMRQSSQARVRQDGESAVYRHPEVPEGFPLRRGLGIRDPNDPPYAPRKDGDIRDIWKGVMGEIPLLNKQKTRILTVFGRTEVVQHGLVDMNREIAVLGKHIKKNGGTRVAVYLPNSAEFLCTLFATAFYGLTVILIPYNQPHPLVVEYLKETKADVLIAAAGSLPLEILTSGKTSLKQLVWVVEKTSRHMDWTEVPEGLGGSIDVSVWHQLVQDHHDSPPTKHPDLKTEELGKIVAIWHNPTEEHREIVEFSHENFAAAIGGLVYSIPSQQRLNESDLFFSADSFTNSYNLCMTLAAMFCGGSVAINSVAGPDVDLTFAAKNISPTVVAASAESAAKLHAAASPAVQGGLSKVAHAMQSQTLAAGAMPSSKLVTQFAATKSAMGSTPGVLRLLFVADKAGFDNPPLSSHDLCDLRIFTGARVVYALTAARVAGAVAQTSVFDYRSKGTPKNKHSHFGVPLSCVEVKLVDTDEHKTTDECTKGDIVVSGPAVAGSGASVSLGVVGTFREDGTLAYV